MNLDIQVSKEREIKTQTLFLVFVNKNPGDSNNVYNMCICFIYLCMPFLMLFPCFCCSFRVSRRLLRRNLRKCILSRIYSCTFFWLRKKSLFLFDFYGPEEKNTCKRIRNKNEEYFLLQVPLFHLFLFAFLPNYNQTIQSSLC